MEYKQFNKIQRTGIKNALIMANKKLENLKNKGYKEEDAIDKILVEGYNN